MLLANILLAVAWSALQGEASLQSLLVGFVFGYLILFLLDRGGVLAHTTYVGQVGRVIGLAGFFLWELVIANLRLAVDVARPRFKVKPGIIAVPLDANEDSQILLLSMLINTTPGSVALDVSPDRRTLYVHVMYMESPEAAREEIKRGFERRVLGVLG